MNDENPYRCTETIDLEEIIKMTIEKEATKSKAVVFWKSGRTEEFYADLNKGGEFKKSFTNKVDAHRNFPTVQKVEVTKV